VTPAHRVFDLERFVEAQAGVHEQALAELRAGRKASHWMWFVFPQLLGLGRSPIAQRYGIVSLDEAKAYLAHPLLGVRLREVAAAILEGPGADAEQILGPIDAIKLRSSMTLFQRAAPGEPVFRAVLDRFFGGVEDPATVELLSAAG
jgi:uncharacterized protein (DUF1810 family)